MRFGDTGRLVQMWCRDEMKFARWRTGVLFLKPENQFAIGQTTGIDRTDAKTTGENLSSGLKEQQLLPARIAEKVSIVVAVRGDRRDPFDVRR